MTAKKVQHEQTAGDLIAVESKPAAINVNFSEVRQALEQELQRYDVVVTSDTVKDAKALATELNKNAAEFNRMKREAVERVSGPIKEFEGQMKELVTMCKDGRQRILDQVAKFEDETRELATRMMTELLAKERDKAGITEEFAIGQTPNPLLTHITNKNSLNKSAKDAVADIVQHEKAMQDRTEKRLLMLENASYKAGLKAPLTRAHVESFLFLDDEQYQQRLDAMLESELKREAQAAESHRQQFQKEQERKEAEARQQDQAEPNEADLIRKEMAALTQEMNYEDNPRELRHLSDKKMELEVDLAQIVPVDPKRLNEIKAIIKKGENAKGPDTPYWSNDINKAHLERMRKHYVALGGTLDETEESNAPNVVSLHSGPAPRYDVPNGSAGNAFEADPVMPTAVGALADPSSAVEHPATFQQGKEFALDARVTTGIWRAGELVAIVHQGELFQKTPVHHVPSAA